MGSARVHWMALASVMIVAGMLRVPGLERIPNGLFLDEASRGYDAYSIVRTGADQYGVPWPIFAEGLGDFTPALYTYLAVPFVGALGLSELAVRLPSALIGTVSVGLAYLVARSFFGPGIGLGTAALLAISPWHVLPSRTGAEWALLPAFTMLGFWLLKLGLGRPPLLVVAGAVLGVGLYSYAFGRLLIPLLLVGFAIIWNRELRRSWPWGLVAFGIFTTLALPIAWFGATPAGQARLLAVAPLNRLGPQGLATYLLTNYASFFDPGFLIWGAETSHHHRLAGFGPVLAFMAPLVLFGLLEAARRHERRHLFWVWWLLVAPAASALHRESPSSALLMGAIPSWQVVGALGGASLARWAETVWTGGRRLVLAGIVAVAALTTLHVGKALYVDYPVYAARDWEYGADQVVRFLEDRRAGYDGVAVSDRLDTPHILVLFFAGIDPAGYQRSPIHVRQPNVRSRGEMGQYRFGRIEDLLEVPGRQLVWVGGEERVAALERLSPLVTVTYPDGSIAHRVYEVAR